MRRIAWPALLAVALCACDDGGDTGGGADDGVRVDGGGRIDRGVDPDMQPGADGGGPGDMAPRDDMQVEVDQAVEADRGQPDQGPPADMDPADMNPADMARPDMQPADMAQPECEPGASRACGDCAGASQVCGDDGTWQACEAPAEVCNGQDDDCDGATDEGFDALGEACSAGVGACAAQGRQVCAAEGAGVVCNAVPAMARPEVCDGLDNDCDEVTDEDVREACYDGPEGTLGVGACAQGARTCMGGAFGACEGATVPVAERCDGLDNDCDGVVDEGDGGVALVEACYEGPAGTAGVGVCRGGQRSCVGGAFGPCEGQALPGQEICDQADNDCNGEVDDTPVDCGCEPGVEVACYSGPEGTVGVGACEAGTQRCDANGELGACQGERVPEAEACDGQDNDCDGETDEEVAGADVACTVGLGACAVDGVTVCDGEQGALVCDARPGEPADEICDGVDNDCDGQTDEGTGVGEPCEAGVGACLAVGVQRCDDNGGVACDARAGAPRPELCNGVDDNCDGQTDEGLGLGEACEVGVGVCRAVGALACDAEGQVACSAVAGQAGAEACDGLDNDCDGRVDEGNPGGGQDCNTGRPGVCAAGTRVCEGGAFTCQQRAQPGAEVCDGLDNDCDGRVDQDANGPLAQACYTGPMGTAGVGACRRGRQTCQGGDFGGCVGEVVPQAEICDSADNDCNGAVDDLPNGACVCQPGATQACYSGPAGTRGVGLCQAGRQTCRPDGTGFGACDGEVLPGAEVCDGADNDCDGDVDDAPGVGVGCAAGTGECARNGRLVCDAMSGDLVCDARPGQPQPEICDGLDNDCNGTRDDVVGLGDRCSNGQGLCARAGNLVCDLNRQELACNARAGDPVPEVCDGQDQDCDGRTDEESPGVGARCQAGTGECRAVGVTVCAGREGVQCGAVPGDPRPETCDLLDNDCDARTDEEAAGVGDACTVGVGLCARDGVQACSPNGGVQCQAQPGQPAQELCDGDDNDCDGETDEGLNCTVFRSCAHAREQGAAADGIYVVDADGDGPGEAQSVWCDQTTDGGGWTLVGSTRNTALNDQASAWYADLLTLAPAQGNAGIWGGLRPLGERFDVRFTCRAAVEAADAPFDVDLSFYDTPWYTEFTTGTDAESCFSESNGFYADSPVPARRDNVGGRFRRRTDAYNAVGYLEGEDNCADSNDFTVDFDDRGMDGNQSDGTDWGEDDGSRKCGANGLAGGQWFVWARERPRVAVIGLSAGVTTVLRDAGFLVEALAYDAALPAKLTHDRYDTLVIGRYATDWSRMTQPLKEALDVFGRDGGNIVTEWDGAAIFMTVYDQTFRYSVGAAQQLAWFGGRIGHGSSRGSNTAITQTVPGDPLFDGVANPFQAGSATEFFFTLADVGGVEFPVTLQSETLATFPGGANGFPAGNLAAIERGRYCGGHMIFAPFDWQDDPENAGLGALLPNLVEVASGPPPAHLQEACKAPQRPVQMVCGNSARNVTEFGLSGRVVSSCVPDNTVQVMWVTRSGAANVDRVSALAYLNAGGIIVGEFSISDELYNTIFAGNVEQGVRNGACGDNIMPQVQALASDGFWQDNRFDRTAQNASGCGHDLSAFPNIKALGGWTPATTQIAYRDQGKGRVWFVEADWQDGQAISAASKGLMHYMATHAAGGNSVRGATFGGVRQNQNINTYLQRGFRPCFSTPYNSRVALSDVQEACQGDVLMMACRQVGTNTLRVAAVGARAEVFEDVGDANGAVNAHNGVNWYYSEARSWGFAPGGQAVNRNSCDTNNQANNDRLCWHTAGGDMTAGWRCGDQTGLNGNADWERVVLDRFGDVP
ncbi:MAG: hypothetical protein H6702_18130 [Myxococcales bacterium]|nr:hypothetical protein [Myxococcales bacterium]